MIAVINHLLEMNIFVLQQLIVEIMKEIVIITVNVKAITFVDQTTVRLHWALTLKVTAAVVLKL